MAFLLAVSILICLSFYAHAFILNGITLSPLPQLAEYGRSMVLVGGNLQDNNSKIYNNIVEMAVSDIVHMVYFLGNLS